jgi:hydrogenase-4 component B
MEGSAEIGFLSASTMRFLHAAEWIFLFSGGLTFAYMLKLFLCVFVERNADAERQARYDDAPDCMDALSTTVITLSALLLLPLGQPWIVERIANFAAGSFGATEAPLHFAAFAGENLKGAAVSLSIGASVYLAFVRPVLRPHGAYVNRWPSALNLYERLYAPLFAKWLPALCGNVARLFAENVLSRRVCRALMAFSGSAAELFAENALLRRVCRAALLTASVLAQAMGDSLDALILLLRRTAIREVKVRDEQSALRVGRFRAFRRATASALDAFPFSFALMMACLGVILALGVLLALL